jgi:hypothetical protein
MMSANAYNISLTYSQILELVRQLPKSDKARLGKELAKDVIDLKLTRLLKSFQTDELTEEMINEEVEKVREEIYAKRQEN